MEDTERGVGCSFGHAGLINTAMRTKIRVREVIRRRDGYKNAEERDSAKKKEMLKKQQYSRV